MADSDGLGSQDDLRAAVEQLREDVDTLQDKVMMERLEDIAIEDELEFIEDLLEHGEGDLRQKLQLLTEIEERSDELQVEQKLNYLYNELQDVKEEMTAGDLEEEVAAVHDRMDRLEQQIREVGSDEDDRDLDDIYDKLYTLRDRMQELQDTAESGDVEIDEAFVQRVVDELRPRISGRIDELADRIDDIEAGGSAGVDAAALDDIRSRLAEVEAASGGEGGVPAGLVDRVEELESRVAELPAESGDGTVPADIGDRLDALADRVAALEERPVEETGGGDVTALQERVAALADQVDELDVDAAAGPRDFAPEQDMDAWMDDIEERMDRLEDEMTDADAVHDRLDALADRISGMAAEAGGDVDAAVDELRAEVDKLRADMEDIASGRDEAVQNRIDMLLEALEEGLAEEEERFETQIRMLQEAIEAGLHAEDEKIDEGLSRLESALASTTAEAGEAAEAPEFDTDEMHPVLVEKMEQIETALRQELEERIKEIERSHPTVVE